MARLIEPAERTNYVTYAIRDIVVKAKQLEAAGKKILYLNIGDPPVYDSISVRAFLVGIPAAGCLEDWRDCHGAVDIFGQYRCGVRHPDCASSPPANIRANGLSTRVIDGCSNGGLGRGSCVLAIMPGCIMLVYTIVVNFFA